jgi:Pyridine nucleotide-disulphide oxidoreductase
VNSSNWLIATLNNENVHKKLSREIERAGNISLILQDKVHIPENIPTATLLKEEILLETQKGRSISTDLIFNAIGTKPSSELVAKADGEAINDQGFVRIKGDLRIRSNKVAKYIAIGDVNDNPFRKTVMNTFSQVPVAVATVLKSISPQSGIQDKQFGPPMSGMLIPFGPKGGIAKFPFGVFGGWAGCLYAKVRNCSQIILQHYITIIKTS